MRLLRPALSVAVALALAASGRSEVLPPADRSIDSVVDQFVDAKFVSEKIVPAAQADLLRRAGRVGDAEVRYLEAIALAPTVEVRAQLQRRLERRGVAGTTPS